MKASTMDNNGHMRVLRFSRPPQRVVSLVPSTPTSGGLTRFRWQKIFDNHVHLFRISLSIPGKNKITPASYPPKGDMG